MKTTITHTCGHQEEIVVYGKRADREKKIEWLESQPCAECRAAESAEISKSTGMVELTGSAKQIAWAEDLRAETMDAIAALKTRTDDEAARKDRVIKYIGGITSAAWWIDNHFYVGAKMVRRAIKHAAEHGVDLIAEPAAETVEEPVAEPVEAAETAETTAETTEPAEEPVEEPVKETAAEPVTAAETTETDDIMEYLLNPPEPPPMTQAEKEEYEFDRDVSTLVGLLGFLDDRADDRILCFKHDVVKAKGKDYWNKVAAEALDYQDKVIAAALE